MTQQEFIDTNTLNLGIEGLVSFEDNLNDVGKKRSNTLSFIFERVFTELGEKIKPRLRTATPRGETGALRSSTDFRLITVIDKDQGETEYRLEMIQTARSAGFTYRPIVVSGRLSGKMPPTLALQGWVQLKWGLSGIKLEQGAFRLARHIAAHGTQANTYTLDVIKDSMDDIAEAARQLGQELTVSIQNF